jgi:hypothetical protein
MQRPSSTDRPDRPSLGHRALITRKPCVCVSAAPTWAGLGYMEEKLAHPVLQYSSFPGGSSGPSASYADGPQSAHKRRKTKKMGPAAAQGSLDDVRRPGRFFFSPQTKDKNSGPVGLEIAPALPPPVQRHHRRGPTAARPPRAAEPRRLASPGQALATPAATAAQTTKRAGLAACPSASIRLKRKAGGARLAGLRLRLPAAHARRVRSGPGPVARWHRRGVCRANHCRCRVTVKEGAAALTWPRPSVPVRIRCCLLRANLTFLRSCCLIGRVHTLITRPGSGG